VQGSYSSYIYSDCGDGVTVSLPQTKYITHLVEIRYLCDVAQVNDGKVLHLLGDRVERLVHYHALRVPVMPETNNNYAILFRFDRLIDVPARGKVGQKIGHPSHRVGWWLKVKASKANQLTRTLSGSSSPHTTMASTQRPIVFMDVNIGETPAGRLKMELFSDIVPKYVT